MCPLFSLQNKRICGALLHGGINGRGKGAIMEWMLMPYRRYFDFSGRSQRKEYWMFALLYLIVAIVFGGLILSGMPMSDLERAAETGIEPAAPGPLMLLGATGLGLFVLGSLIPAVAVAVRRFHDQDKSGWFVLLNFVPYVGGLILLVFMCIEGTRGPNRFGPDPKDPNSVDVFS